MRMPTVSAPSVPPTVASLLALAQVAKGVHEQVAATMDRLAERGGPDAVRRRKLAERSRGFADMEARHISYWQARLDADREA